MGPSTEVHRYAAAYLSADFGLLLAVLAAVLVYLGGFKLINWITREDGYDLSDREAEFLHQFAGSGDNIGSGAPHLAGAAAPPSGCAPYAAHGYAPAVEPPPADRCLRGVS